MRVRATWAVAIGVCGLLALAGCSGDDDDGGAGEDSAATTEAAEATTTTAPETLDILVTNDDGIEGQGMADLVDGLQDVPNAEVTVVVPDADRTGTDGQTTAGGVTGAEATTVNGDDAVAVTGFAADSVIYALDEVYPDGPPDLVVSGINAGQNIGPAVPLSGTVGAARQAASQGVPSLAVSQGLTDEFDYSTGVERALAWVEEHRDEVLADETAEGEQAPAVNLNIPSCPTGEPRELIEVPIAEDAPSDQTLGEQDCMSTLEDPANDVEGFVNGFVVLSDLPTGLSDPG